MNWETVSQVLFICTVAVFVAIAATVGIAIDYQIKKAAAKAAIEEVQRERGK